MANYNLLPQQQFFDSSGNPLASGTVTAYSPDTSSYKAIYTDHTGVTQQSNPVTLNSSGMVSGGIWGSGLYDIVVKDSDGNTILSWDSVGNALDVTTTTSTATSNTARIYNLVENSEFTADTNSFGSALSDGDDIGNSHYCLTQTTTITPSQLTSTSDTNLKTGLRLTNGATAQRVALVSPVRAISTLAVRSQKVQASVKVRTSIAGNIRIALVAQTTTMDSPTVDVVNTWTSTTYTAGNFFISGTTPLAADNTSSVNVVSVLANTWTTVSTSMVVPASCTNLILVVWTESTLAASATLDFSAVQVYEYASALSYRPDPAAITYAQRLFRGDVSATVTTGSLISDVGTGTCSSNAVTINKMSGQITTESLSTAAGSSQAITLTDSKIASGDLIFISRAGGSNTRRNFDVTGVAGSGGAVITIYNNEPSNALNGTIILNFLVIKNAT